MDYTKMYFLLHLPRSGIPGSFGNSVFVLRNCQTVFQSSYTNFHSYQQCMKVLVSPPPSQHICLSFELQLSLCVCEVVFHCDFDLCFFNDQWYWASFYVQVCHLYVLLGELSIQVLHPFLRGFFPLFISSCKSSLYILVKILSDT